MGAIARNIANNITTSGVFTSGAITNNSVTGITVLANASDGITSNSASLSFTSGLDSTYKAYKFVFVNINPANDNVFFDFNLSSDAGSNYNVTKTTTAFRAYHTEGGAAPTLEYYSSIDLAQSTSFQNIAGEAGSGADESVSGSLILFNPSSTTYVKHFLTNSNQNTYHDLTMNTFIAGYGNTTSAVNAIRFQMSSGNFDGTIYLYGIK
jgi:hypothetical protein